ncbi:glycine zipper family protein [Brackiella oedipodis]|uniref:glycine zipper family protein n=1 Tax=Brackiella oedipodis TaxID=124225 RepID=UPI00048BEED1|nr:glycine zipper family protein [Brackiella oedipodis]
MKSHLLKVSALAAILALTACGTNYRPMVDSKGQDMSFYESDLMECQHYAEQNSTVTNTAGSTLLGAALGTAIGAVSGGNHNTLASGAAIGGITGLAGGGAKAHYDEKHIIRECMRGRGYRVLD